LAAAIIMPFSQIGGDDVDETSLRLTGQSRREKGGSSAPASPRLQGNPRL
jgi:hypothetical protein